MNELEQAIQRAKVLEESGMPVEDASRFAHYEYVSTHTVLSLTSEEEMEFTAMLDGYRDILAQLRCHEVRTHK